MPESESKPVGEPSSQPQFLVADCMKVIGIANYGSIIDGDEKIEIEWFGRKVILRKMTPLENKAESQYVLGDKRVEKDVLDRMFKIAEALFCLKKRYLYDRVYVAEDDTPLVVVAVTPTNTIVVGVTNVI